MSADRIAVLGGSFDPIHLGHLNLAKEVRYRLNLDRVWLMPAFQSPNKLTDKGANAEARWAMVNLAIREEPQLEACDLELERKGVSYTHETLEALHIKHPETDWSWILGLDTFLDFPGWKNQQRILELANLIVVPRSGSDESALQKTLNALARSSQSFVEKMLPGGSREIVLAHTGKKITLMKMPLIDVASREIRREFYHNPEIKKRLPPSVVQYIMDNQLYY